MSDIWAIVCGIFFESVGDVVSVIVSVEEYILVFANCCDFEGGFF
jgi:hypothetical protein